MSRIGIETDRDTRTLPIRFQIAERSVWVARRRVRHIGFSLADLLAGRLPHVPDLAPREDGIDLRSIPDAAATALCHDGEGLPGLVRQRYPRHFLRLTGTFEHYLQGFSAKSRSTLKRKRKRWTEASAGLDVRDYHDADRIGEFIDLAGALSRRTYQERLLGAGLPLDPESVAEMRHRATHAALRAHILFHRGQPAAYLYLPIEDGTLIYAHLGHEPGLADLSPGTVLQFEVLERLFPDPTQTLFDFTEGDGAHKRLFGREHIDCADVLLLRPTLRNRLLLAGLAGFDGSIAWIGRKTEASGIKPALKRMLRG